VATGAARLVVIISHELKEIPSISKNNLEKDLAR